MAKDDAYLVCLRVADLRVAVPGSTKKRCADCAEAVWVSPASLTLSKKRHLPLLCMSCAGKRAAEDEEGLVVEPPTEEQLREIRDTLERG